MSQRRNDNELEETGWQVAPLSSLPPTLTWARVYGRGGWLSLQITLVFYINIKTNIYINIKIK